MEAAFAGWRSDSTLGRQTFRTGSRGTLVGDARGRRPFARRRPGRRKISEGARVQARTPCRMPPHQPAGIAKQAVLCERVLNAGSTKRTSIVYHGSSSKCLRRKGAVMCVWPLGPPQVPSHVGLERSIRAGTGGVGPMRTYSFPQIRTFSPRSSTIPTQLLIWS